MEGITIINALIYISAIDSNINYFEKRFFYNIGKELGYSKDTINESIEKVKSDTLSLKEILSHIKTYETKEYLIKLLIDLCYVDGEYSDDEKKGLIDLCFYLDFDPDILEKLEKENSTYLAHETLDKDLKKLKEGVVSVKDNGIKGFKFLGKNIAKGLGVINTKLSEAIASNKKLRQEVEEYKKILNDKNIDDAAKQEIIIQLNNKLSSLSAELSEERTRADQNQEIINLLESSISEIEMAIDNSVS